MFGGSLSSHVSSALTTASASPVSSFKPIIRLSIEKLIKNVNGRKHKQIREECLKVLEELKEIREDHIKSEEKAVICGNVGSEEESRTLNRNLNEQESNNSQKEDNSHSLTNRLISKINIFSPFRLACESDNPKIAAAGLDGIQKLLSYNILKNDVNGLLKATEEIVEEKKNKDFAVEKEKFKKKETMYDVVIKTICNSVVLFNDNDVHLQVIRCLLIAVTSSECNVHGSSLILSVRTLFKIFTESRDVVTQRTSQTALVQIVNNVTQRVDLEYLSCMWQNSTERNAKGVRSLTDRLDEMNAEEKQDLDVAVKEEEKPRRRDFEINLEEGGLAIREEQKGEFNGALQVWLRAYMSQLVDETIRLHSKSREDFEQTDLKNEINEDCGKYGWCVVCRKSAQHYCLQTKDPVCGKKCKEVNLKYLNYITFYGSSSSFSSSSFSSSASSFPSCFSSSFSSSASSFPSSFSSSSFPSSFSSSSFPSSSFSSSSFSSSSFSSSSFSSSSFPSFDFVACRNKSACPHGEDEISRNATSPAEQQKVASSFHASLLSSKAPPCALLAEQDALMLFQSLCKLSMKDIVVSNTPDNRFVRSKRLALELLLSMLKNGGDAFKKSERFISIIKSLLCISLIKNCVSHIPRIFSLSLSLFLILIANYKCHLRTEIGVFVDQILLRILDSDNSSFEHKQRVLQVLNKICSDARISLELFINFDCDVEEKDVFERMIECLSNITLGKSCSIDNNSLILPQQEMCLRRVALEALLVLISSVALWVGECRDEKEKKCITSEDKKEFQEKKNLHCKKAEFENVKEKQSTLGITDEEVDQAAAHSISLHGSPKSQIYHKRLMKKELQKGIVKFNANAKKGIEYLIKNKHIKEDAEEVARFLLWQEGLSKSNVGDFLGSDDEFCKNVLLNFVNLFDFQNMELDLALRKFLQSFRLPGEAQKIDRMMERFAEKYANQNPHKFKCADCAYVLSFSLIMLHTDSHSKEIKPEYKMTKNDFIKNNRGINQGEDLPKEYLGALYDRVVAEEWILEEEEIRKIEDSAADDFFGGFALGISTSSRKKFELFLRETKGMVTRSTELIKRKEKRGREHIMVTEEHLSYVRFLLEVTIPPFLAAISALFEVDEDVNTLENCLLGFKYSIQLTSWFDMSYQRNLLFSCLSKYCFGSNQCIQKKNIKCIQLVLWLGLNEGEYLNESWNYVLRCVSLLDKLQLIHNNILHDDTLLNSSSTVSNNTSIVCSSNKSSSSMLPFIPISASTAGGINVSGVEASENSKSSFVGTSAALCPPGSDTASSENPPRTSLANSAPNYKLTNSSLSLNRASPSLSSSFFVNLSRFSSKTTALSSSMSYFFLPASVVSSSTASSFSCGLSLLHSSSCALNEGDMLLLEHPNNFHLILHDIDLSLIDLLFNKSVNLSSTAIIHFVTYLCAVSKEELSTPSAPRFFSLQKLVEVADFNMNRIRLVWSQIWDIIKQHFAETALHACPAVCMYAIDSLRQLAIKFLEKNELSKFNFQLEFLKPFLAVMTHSCTTEEIKEFIVHTIFNIIQTRGYNIKSGWKLCISLLDTAAQQNDLTNDAKTSSFKSRLNISFETLEFILNEKFDSIQNYMSDIVRCLASFAVNTVNQEIALKAVKYIELSVLALLSGELRVSNISSKAGRQDDYNVARKNEYNTVNGLPTEDGLIKNNDLCDINLSYSKAEAPHCYAASSSFSSSSFSFPSSSSSSSFSFPSSSSSSFSFPSSSSSFSSSSSSSSSFSSSSSSSSFSLDVCSASSFAPNVSTSIWFIVLNAFAQITCACSCFLSVRTAAISHLFDFLVTQGVRLFDGVTWKMVFRGVLLPLFDDLHLNFDIQNNIRGNSNNNNNNNNNSCNKNTHDNDNVVNSVKNNVNSHNHTEMNRVVQSNNYNISHAAPKISQNSSFCALDPVSNSVVSNQAHSQETQNASSSYSTSLSSAIDSYVNAKNTKIHFKYTAASTHSNRSLNPHSYDHNPETEQWAEAFCYKSMKLLVQLFHQHFHKLQFLLNELLILLISYIEIGGEVLSRLGVEALKDFIQKVGRSCNSAHWHIIAVAIQNLFRRTIPLALFSINSSFPISASTDPSSVGLQENINTADSQKSSLRSTNNTSLCEMSQKDIEKLNSDANINDSILTSLCLSATVKEINSGRLVELTNTSSNSVSESDDSKQLQFDMNEIVTKCIIQLLLIDLIQGVIPPHSNVITGASLAMILDALDESIEFARVFNKNIEYRMYLKELGFMSEMKQLPGLLKQERDGLSAYLNIVTHIICFEYNQLNKKEKNNKEGENRNEELATTLSFEALSKNEKIETNEEVCKSSSFCVTEDANLADRFFTISRRVIQQYLTLEQQLRIRSTPVDATQRDDKSHLQHLVQLEAEREALGLIPIICNNILYAMLRLPDTILRKCLDELFSSLVDLIPVNSKDIRQLVRSVFVTRFPSLLTLNFNPMPPVNPYKDCTTYTSVISSSNYFQNSFNNKPFVFSNLKQNCSNIRSIISNTAETPECDL